MVENKQLLMMREMPDSDFNEIAGSFMRKEPLEFYDGFRKTWMKLAEKDYLNMIETIMYTVMRHPQETKPIFPWRIIDKEFNWLAVDKNDQWSVFNYKPIVNYEQDAWTNFHVADNSRKVSVNVLMFDRGNILNWSRALFARNEA
jgi:hypothetical protein